MTVLEELDVLAKYAGKTFSKEFVKAYKKDIKTHIMALYVILKNLNRHAIVWCCDKDIDYKYLQEVICGKYEDELLSKIKI